jgi:hypothetical protein
MSDKEYALDWLNDQGHYFYKQSDPGAIVEQINDAVASELSYLKLEDKHRFIEHIMNGIV